MSPKVNHFIEYRFVRPGDVEPEDRVIYQTVAVEAYANHLAGSVTCLRLAAEGDALSVFAVAAEKLEGKTRTAERTTLVMRKRKP